MSSRIFCQYSIESSVFILDKPSKLVSFTLINEGYESHPEYQNREFGRETFAHKDIYTLLEVEYIIAQLIDVCSNRSNYEWGKVVGLDNVE
jgi:hypothetical protein